MRPIEIEAKTIDEAIDKAMEILKVSREELDIQILTEPKLGLFGKNGGKPVKIRATIKDKKT